MKKTFLLIVIATLLFSCKKDKAGCTNSYAKNYDSEAKKADNCQCIMYVDEMTGTWKITVTYYPLQTSQQGEQFEAKIFNKYGSCPVEDYRFDDVNWVRMYNFNYNFECETFALDKYKFTVSNSTWAGAALNGTGTIQNGVLHFEGIVRDTSAIILDGIKLSADASGGC